jgi:hypothetical protein
MRSLQPGGRLVLLIELNPRTDPSTKCLNGNACLPCSHEAPAIDVAAHERKNGYDALSTLTMTFDSVQPRPVRTLNLGG